LHSHRIRPIPKKAAPKNLVMINPSGASVISYTEPVRVGIAANPMPKTIQTMDFKIRKVLSFII
jgi:hypothetical protein